VGDWRDDLASKVADQIANRKQATEDSNNKAKLIEARGQSIWDSVLSTLNGGIDVVNKRAGSAVITLKQDSDGGREEVALTYNVSGAVHGRLTWTRKAKAIQMSVGAKAQREFNFYVEDGNVVLMEGHHSLNGEDLGREFLKGLTTP
jgi:hypothetical protein